MLRSFGAMAPQMNYAQPPQPYWNAFNYGMGGTSGGGQITPQDDARVRAGLMRAQYEAALRNRNNSQPGMGDWQINNIYNEMRRYENEAATGQATSMFTRPTYETPYAMYNEMARVGPGQITDFEQWLPSSLMGQNTGARWQGFQATPIGTSFGGGVNMDSGGGYVRTASTTAPSDANRASAFSNPYNGGAPNTAGVLGGPGGRIPYSYGGGTPLIGNNPPQSIAAPTQGAPVRGYNPRMGESPSGWNNSGASGYYAPGSSGEARQNQQLREQQRMQQLYTPQELGRFGATAVPYGPPSTVDYRQNSGGFSGALRMDTAAHQGIINDYTRGVGGALQQFSNDLQSSFGSIPASVRAEQMGRDMGVFGGEGTPRYQTRLSEVYGPWNMGGMYSSGNSALNQGMLDAYFGPHYSYAPAPRMSVFGSRY